MTEETHSEGEGDLGADPRYLFAVQQIQRVLTKAPLTDADHASLDRIIGFDSLSSQQFFFDLATINEVEITPGLWAFYMAVLINDWNEGAAQDTAVLLPTFRESHPSNGPAQINALLDAVANSLAALGWAAYDSETDSPFREGVLHSFYRLAVATEQLGDADTAFNLAALALDLGKERGAEREEVVRYALSLAITADRMHQIAVCSTELAVIVAEAADFATDRRLEAFDCCETALDRIVQAPKDFQANTASLLASVLHSRDYLRPLLLPLFLFLPPEMQPTGLLQELGFAAWPERVSTLPRSVWIEELRGLITAQFWDIQLDKARMGLEPPPTSATAHADWTAWTVDHPAYRRAVPHLRSFLREADFDSHFLVLTHEITHVLSLIGGIGAALTALRAATLDAELTLWSTTARADTTELQSRIVAEAVAPLVDGNAGSLFRAEQSIELTLKARSLQDIWTPWLEGLAIFGEIAADPARDSAGIGHVTNCVRGFLDFNFSPPEPGASADSASALAAFEELIADFEARCTAAIKARGPVRLSAYCRTKEVPYFSGFLAVRSIVSTWRATTGRPLTGTSAFNLLLHATRHGTFGAIPDLSLRSDLFATAGLKMMCDWIYGLARLTREEIDDFLAPPERDGPGRTYRWTGGHLITVAPEEVNMAEAQSAMIERRLQEALSSLTRPEDIERLTPTDDLNRELLRENSNIMRGAVQESAARSLRLAEALMTAGTLLPVGHADTRFFLNVDPAALTSYLATQLRTTEAHVTGGDPSFNGFWFPIPNAAGQLIAEDFRRLGSSRLQVTRVIDLGGVFVRGEYRIGTHVLAFSYGDWFEVRGPTQAVEAIIDADADYKAQIRDLIRRRLQPSPLSLVELKVIAPGQRGAARTRAWIDRSTSWTIAEQHIAIDMWVAHVRALAEQVLSDANRGVQKNTAARAILLTLTGDAHFADLFVTTDFETLTEDAPEFRHALIDALFETAQGPSVTVSAAAEALPEFWNRVFLKGPQGWDVRTVIAPLNQGEYDEHAGYR